MNDAAIRANQEATEERRHTEVIAALRRIEELLAPIAYNAGYREPVGGAGETP